MDLSGAGDIAGAKRAKAPSNSAATGVDRFSELPDDILAKILRSASSHDDAVRTCVLSRRWRSVWKLLPDLHFSFFPDPAGGFRKALDDHQVRLRHLKIDGDGHGQGGLPRSLATWLPAAARHVSGCFALRINKAPASDARPEDEEVTIELPCFKHATSISIGLRFRGRLAFPPAGDSAGAGAGVFSCLTELSLEGVHFQDPSALGDAISSEWCPCLQTFHICNGLGLEKLAVSSTSLLKLELEQVRGLQELSVDAPELKELHVVNCFFFDPVEAAQLPLPQPVLAITAPGLEVVDWRDSAIEDALRFGYPLPHLRSLGTFFFFVYGDDDCDSYNRDCLEVLQGFRSIETLTLMLTFVPGDINDDYEYLMEAITMLPADLTTLELTIMSGEHCFGDSLLHVLRMCARMRKLVLELYSDHELKVRPFTCSSGCICRQRSNWQTEELALVFLEEIVIHGFGASGHDIKIVEKLFGWATSLTKATIFFDESVTEGLAKELFWMFQVFHMPNKLHIDFRYHNETKVVVCAPEE